jgi:CRP/FNR family transcriptional regulator
MSADNPLNNSETQPIMGDSDLGLGQNIHSQPKIADYASYGNESGYIFHKILREHGSPEEHIKSYKKGQAIFTEGQHANGLFCILDGKVKISKSSGQTRDQIVRLAKSRDVIGYRALIANEVYHASAIALENTKVGYVPKQTFFQILNNHPDIVMGMMKLLSKDLESAENKLVDIATKSVKIRLAEVLLLLKETYGLKADNLTINVNLTRIELAAIVGTAPEVVIRQLAKFKKEGLLKTKARSIFLLNIPKLVELANLQD